MKVIDCDNNAVMPLMALLGAILAADPEKCPVVRLNMSAIDPSLDFIGCDNNAYQDIEHLLRQIPVVGEGGKPAINVVLSGPIVPPSYTVSTLPDATVYPGGIIHVTDETGGPTNAYSNGTNWLRNPDDAIVS